MAPLVVFFLVYRCILNFILCNDRDLVFSSIFSGPKSCSPWKKNLRSCVELKLDSKQVLISFEKVGPFLGVFFSEDVIDNATHF